ncbi:ankyrin repeat domain-containing protein [Paenibacillus sp. KR2-11]|uniref:ankyrin repeat domain-containing protein n=1 Tax=Paenibacillus sp. KR2-11 TaxID=3385500 RepID=UPI0038FC1A03
MRKVWILLSLVILLFACAEKQQTSKAQDEAQDVAVKEDPKDAAVKEERPPLFQAIEDRDIAMVMEIVTTNKEAINQEYEGDTPLIVAVRDSYPGGYLEIIKILVDNGADFT